MKYFLIKAIKNYPAKIKKILLLVPILVLLAASCNQNSTPPESTPTSVIETSSQPQSNNYSPTNQQPQTQSHYGIQTKTSNCTSNQALPDSACTPGAILTTDKSVICVSGYTKTVRNVSDSTRKQVFAEYGISYDLHSNYEVDHLISLELGGSNDISNLFPESYNITNGARVKDKFENYLHSQVCNGKMDIQQAQKEISTNWLKYYLATNPQSATNTPSPAPNPSPSPTPAPTPIPSDNTSGPAVKKSSTGICHAQGTQYYDRTINYTPYNSIDECLASGGRLPK